ncbi:hypothetical protein BJ875DRAFT_445925 [Amylocarpus encephaloides]|uniref:Uncharacterized protein n=1 Tax=Amylocarpus encephaloides TaxID=45428 RepID=A0A9P7Y998_9HELO|nr:hypothetical protein BJ875DRAFT_445925 [Amylocarpus encephaloides]
MGEDWRVGEGGWSDCDWPWPFRSPPYVVWCMMVDGGWWMVDGGWWDEGRGTRSRSTSRGRARYRKVPWRPDRQGSEEASGSGRKAVCTVRGRCGTAGEEGARVAGRMGQGSKGDAAGECSEMTRGTSRVSNWLRQQEGDERAAAAVLPCRRAATRRFLLAQAARTSLTGDRPIVMTDQTKCGCDRPRPLVKRWSFCLGHE